MRIVLASSNPGKLRELSALLTPHGFELLPQSAFTDESAVECGLTFVENAILKARHASRAAGLPALADDSGIEVDALHGAPGVHSARFAGESASDQDNLAKLIASLSSVEPSKRAARYQCVLAFICREDDASPVLAQASWEGQIIDAPRGRGGFGYDPIFVPHGHEITAAQMSAAEKNRISHRGKALAQLVEQMRTLRLSDA